MSEKCVLTSDKSISLEAKNKEVDIAEDHDYNCKESVYNLRTLSHYFLWRFLSSSSCITKRVENCFPNRWNKSYEDHTLVALRQLRTFIVSIQNLIGLVHISMMIRMSLELKEEIVWEVMSRIPWMNLVDGFIDAILIFLSEQAVMLNIVDNLKID